MAKQGKKTYSFEVRDHCEDLYVREEKTYDQISKETDVSVPQLQRWAQEKKDSDGNVIDPSWGDKRRDYRLQLSKAQAEARRPVREKMLLDLMKRKQAYDRYFEKQPDDQIDNQATYAYAGLCQKISEIQKDLDARPDLYRMAPVVMDEFVKFVKKTVKEQPTQETIFGLIDRFFDEVRPDGQ